MAKNITVKKNLALARCLPCFKVRDVGFPSDTTLNMNSSPPFPIRAAMAALMFTTVAHASLEIHEVPAVSSVKRLPDQVPPDALGREGIHFLAAKGEFEPASFLIRSDQDMEGVQLTAGPLKGKAGEIPAANLDIKVVKVWYQDGTAWFSYFADPSRRELVPELLVNDENLVRVDHEKKGNFLRVGGEYRWISYPQEEAEAYFNYLTEPVADAATLQPITLKAGEFKQIWVTLKVPVAAAPGLYEGTIAVEREGKKLATVPVKARVLPFELPAPATYYDLEKPFFVSIYSTGILNLAETLGVPREQAVAQQRRIYENLRDHNVRNPRAETNLRPWFEPKQNDPEKGVDLLRTELTLLKETGADTRPLLSSESLYFSRKAKADMAPGEFEKGGEDFRKRLDIFRKTVKEVLGHTDIYATSWDEAGVSLIKAMREQSGFLADYPDLKMWVTTSLDKHSHMAGYLMDYANQAGWPTREQAATWHAQGSKIASYASPHTGVENPDTYRRWEGLARYKANYDGSFNYKLYSQLHPTLYERQKANTWNDSAIGTPTFRTFNMVYPVSNGVIDTLAWEGFREGIDDIRYATLLKQRAEAAEASGNQQARHLGRKALSWLELTDMKSTDLNAARREMINYILEIDNLLKNVP